MATRTLYIARHGEADAAGELTDIGQRQAALLGERLAGFVPDAVWHSPLPRATRTAEIIGERLPGVPVAVAAELDDHLPYAPDPADLPPPLREFLAAYDDTARASGARLAAALIARFARPDRTERREVLVTHAFQIAWLVRHALDAPPERWMGLNHAAAALTVIEYRDGRPPALITFNEASHL